MSRASTATAGADAVVFLGKRWNGVILGTLTHGPAGFSELRRAVRGISDSVLSARLIELVKAGLLVRSVNEGPPVSVDYRLTPSGEALLPALLNSPLGRGTTCPPSSTQSPSSGP